MDLTLVVLAAGRSSRYGDGFKQVDAVGPGGASLVDYGIYDAIRAGFRHVLFVACPELEAVMRARIAAFPAGVDGDVVFQSVDDLPDGAPRPAARAKPWGTGHAVLAAAGLVRDPFAAINADDFYGAAAYRAMAAFLGRARFTYPHPAAMIGYRLADTLSAHAGVSRAICEAGPDGHVQRVTELVEVAERDGRIRGATLDGAPVDLDGATLVSMNFWGFQPTMLGMLRERFIRFLDAYATDPAAEFLLSSAVNDLIADRQITLRALAAGEGWFGMTSRDDRDVVARRLAALVSAGEYPHRLFGA